MSKKNYIFAKSECKVFELTASAKYIAHGRLDAFNPNATMIF